MCKSARVILKVKLGQCDVKHVYQNTWKMTSSFDPVANDFFNVRDYYDLEADGSSTSDSDEPKKKHLKKNV